MSPRAALEGLLARVWPRVPVTGPIGSRHERRRAWDALGRRWTLTQRDADSPMGRHGGGWDYKLGIMVGSRSSDGRPRTVIVNLWTAALRIGPPPKPKPPEVTP